MTTAEQLQALTEKLAALEAQMQPQPGTGNSCSSASPGQITVKIPRERKLWKVAGSRNDLLIEDWILDAEQATISQSDADAVDFTQLMSSSQQWSQPNSQQNDFPGPPALNGRTPRQ